MFEPKIVVFDLETLPNLPQALKHWVKLSSRYDMKTMKATVSSIICAGWKELNTKRTHCINAWDFPNWQEDVNDDYEVCKAIYEVLHDADAVVTHNGTKFDWKFLQTRLLHHKLPLLAKVQHVDTCLIARKNLLVIDNKLNTIGDMLVNEKKLDHTGWQLWVDVHARKKGAQKLMTKYCKQDVALLEKCFKELYPLVHILPNRNLYRSVEQIAEGTLVCPNCGSTDLTKKGFRHTKTRAYQRLRCKNCGTWSRTDGKERNLRTF